MEPYPLEPLFGRLLSPFEAFLKRTTAGGLILMATTVLTLALAAIVGEERLHHVWQHPLSISLGGLSLDMTLHHWVNDGLMALFFLVVGLELKREILVGELASVRDAALPVMAALGGMLVPAACFALINVNEPSLRGWGIPMATDIAFAIGILVLLGDRIPRNLIVFLTALAIADDLGAVLVIAVFYTDTLHVPSMMAAACVLGLLMLLNRGGIRAPLPYWVLGVVLWLALLSSGLHATLAGVLLAFMIPARPRHSGQQFDEHLTQLRMALRAERIGMTADDAFSNHRLATIAEHAEQAAKEVQSPLQRIEHDLTPWVTFLVIPVFALSNAGIDLTSLQTSAFHSPLTLGIIAGLVIGKFVGISLFSALAVRLGFARLPRDVHWGHLTGAAWLGGIGFTMSLFIGQLAFTDATAISHVKLGVLSASALSAMIGVTWLWMVTRSERT